MKRKGLWVVFLALFAAGAANAQITISGGFALSYMDAEFSGSGGEVKAQGDVGMGANVYLDYLLPISIPLSLGFEAGIDSAAFTDSGNGHSYRDTVLTVPFLVRAAYHFDINPKIDLYAVGKLGLAFGVWTGDQRNIIDNANIKVDPDPAFGVGFGVDLGVAYYFVPHFGIFAEGGFDGYILQTELSGNGVTLKLDVPFYRFLTIGISTKF